MRCQKTRGGNVCTVGEGSQGIVGVYGRLWGGWNSCTFFKRYVSHKATTIQLTAVCTNKFMMNIN